MRMLTDNFSYEEMVNSETARKLDIKNVPTEEDIERFKLLCIKVLEPIREHFNLPITVTSGFRTKELCESIGSMKNSQHCKGQAADIIIKGIDTKHLCEYIFHNLDYDQLILEFYDIEHPSTSWCHVSYNEDINHNQYLMSRKASGLNVYTLIGSNKIMDARYSFGYWKDRTHSDVSSHEK